MSKLFETSIKICTNLLKVRNYWHENIINCCQIGKCFEGYAQMIFKLNQKSQQYDTARDHQIGNDF